MDTVFRPLRSIVFVALIFACASALANEKTVLIVGDSLSAAYGVETNKAWVSLLRERLQETDLSGWGVVNASISGETTDGGLRRLPDLLEKHEPQIIVIELGGNDGLRGFPPQVIRKNISSMIEQSQGAGASVLVVGMQIPPNYGQRYTQAFAKIFPELAEKYDTSLVPFFLAGIYDQSGMMQDDEIHPTAEAQPQLLENVWPELKSMMQ